jgi:hypothetical protein
VTVRQGDEVTLRWTTDQRMTIHLHGYDLEQTLAPGLPVAMRFAARATGRFPIEIHGHGQETRSSGIWRSTRSDRIRPGSRQAPRRRGRSHSRDAAPGRGRPVPRRGPRIWPALRPAGPARALGGGGRRCGGVLLRGHRALRPRPPEDPRVPPAEPPPMEARAGARPPAAPRGRPGGVGQPPGAGRGGRIRGRPDPPPGISPRSGCGWCGGLASPMSRRSSATSGLW